MNKRKHKVSEVIWLSPHKFVFKSPFKRGFGDGVGKRNVFSERKRMLIVAEEGQDLRFLEGAFIADELCWFCENGISPYLLGLGYVPSCLLGKDCGG